MGEYLYQQYIDDVLSGRQVVCKWVRLAVERHRDDLVTGGGRGLRFSDDAAQHVIDFFGFLRHSKGEWAGRVVTLEPWQQFVLAMAFGWQRYNDEREQWLRRFRQVFLEVARKNGKSTLAAGVALYLLDADGEAGAEVYCAATKKDQARIAWSEAKRMVQSSAFLRRRIRSVRDNLHILNTASKLEPLGRDTDSMDGLNVHGGIVDELHAHKNRETWDLLDTATGSRRQSLLLGITTAGVDKHSLCWDLHQYTEKVVEGMVQDDTFFGVIYTLDQEKVDEAGVVVEKGDDWEDEAVWVKANPNLYVSKHLDDMRRKARTAKEMPTAQNSFLQRELNTWTQATVRWVNAAKWLACGAAVNEDGLRGRMCFGGLDLSSTSDITAFVLVFPPQQATDPYSVICRFWVPEETMRERSKRDRVLYSTWVRQGYIMATPGYVIDYEYILAEIEELGQRYDIRQVAFDRWGAAQIQTKLLDMGGEEFLVQFGQGFASMSAPTKELERLLGNGRLAHGGNPVLTWMAGNAVASKDAADNIKLDKAKSTEKIDGMIALVMALDRATRGEPDDSSVYDESDIKVL
jgi:phage terminase large subunit-like protein